MKSPRILGKQRRQDENNQVGCLVIHTEGSEDLSSARERTESKSVNVTFVEDDNIIEMGVDASEFPSEDEHIETVTTPLQEDEDSSEEEGEISFNNNASTLVTGLRFENDNTKEQDNVKGSKKSGESEEERENRIISKTVAKLQEMMVAGGYLVNRIDGEKQQQELMGDATRKGENKSTKEGEKTSGQRKRKRWSAKYDKKLCTSVHFKFRINHL